MYADLVDTLLAQPVTPTAAALHLFDGPYVVIDGCRHEVPEGSKRLLVLVALSGGQVERRAAAGTLWPIGNDVRAAGNLRSALWRLRCAGIDLVVSDKYALRLAPGTAVDVSIVSDRAARLIAGRPYADDLDVRASRSSALEFLPGWYDDWVVFERERLRQRLLHGQEALSRHLTRSRHCAESIEAAAAVVGEDPLRESAQRVLIEAYLAEGDVPAARRAFDVYRSVVARELGARPSAELTGLVQALRPVSSTTAASRRPAARLGQHVEPRRQP